MLQVTSTSEKITAKLCPEAPDPYTTGELHMAVQAAKDNLHIIQANNIIDHTLTHRGINNIGLMLDRQNSRADTFFDKLQADHIEVFDKYVTLKFALLYFLSARKRLGC